MTASKPYNSYNSLETVQVLGLGQACVDYLAHLDRYPNEDKKQEIYDLKMGFGGPASTALVTLSSFGISTAFLGSVGDDSFGKGILRNLEKEGVDSSCVKVTPGASSQFAFIAVTKSTGNRTIFWQRGTAPHLSEKDIHLGYFTGAKFLHVDGLMIKAAMEAALQAKKMGIDVVMDAGNMREGSRELASLVDILIASRDFVDALVGSDKGYKRSLRALKSLGPREVVITLGKRGSVGMNDKCLYLQEAFPVSEVDTTGAGDVYHGAYIYALLQGWDMPRCMRLSSAAAALKCKERGAQQGIPSLQSVLDFLEANPSH